jgi:hypothetical protein
MITRLPINLTNTYITRALHCDTLPAVLAENNPHIMHRLYIVTNGLKERQHFLELKHDNYNISATINTSFGYAENAREQASLIKAMSTKIKNRPQFTISFSIHERANMVELFNFKHIATNEQDVYNLIPKLENKIKELI